MNQSQSDPRYTMGRSQHETERLIQQSQLYDGITQRLLKEAGINQGMRVLDVGSGAGDVALAVAELVGTEGEVVGVDVDDNILNTAQERATQSGWTNLSFIKGDPRTMTFEQPFDAVVGRLVLMYMANPEQALSTFSSYLRPGGLIAFQEADFTPWEAFTYSDTPVRNQLKDWSVEVFQRSGAHIGMGLDLHRVFIEAGLPEPAIRMEIPAGASKTWPGYDYAANSIRSLLPLMEYYGIATADEIGVETLAERLRQEVVLSKRPLVLTPHVTAWAQLPT